MTLLRSLLALVVLLAAALASAQTFNVTAPVEGAFLGLNNEVRFLIKGAQQEVRVRVRATGPGGTTEVEGRFTPNADGDIDRSLTLNFSESTPEGAFVIEVTATEPGQTYTPITRNVTVDVTKPKFLTFSPLAGSFVSGIVPIRVVLDEPNVEEWRVQVNNQDIPNNTGTSQSFVVNWDTAGITQDGSHTITIRVRDKADNEATQSINVTLDRVPPVISIQFPRSDSNILPRNDFPVVVDVVDGAQGSVDVTGIDVVLEHPDGRFIARVARTSIRNIGGTVRWSGRVRHLRSNLPSHFNIVVTAVDRAGNVATPQTVSINLGRGRDRR